MKWNQRDLNTALNKAPAALPSLVLIYGDDSGVVRQASEKLLAHTGVDLTDPFAADRLDITDIAAEPARLLESATTVPLLGGQKVIKVEGVTGDLGAAPITALSNAVKSCLAEDLRDVTIIIPAPRVGKDTALARNVEKSKTAAALRCFQDSIRDLGAYIRSTLQQSGKRLEGDAQALLTENLGADRDITQRELEKLVIYVGDAEVITVEDVAACLADAPASNVFKLCDAVGQRDTKQVDTLLSLLLEEGEDPNMLFTMVVRHLRRVLQVREALNAGQNQNVALKSVKPPVLFGQDVFMAQVNRYPLPRLRQVVNRAVTTQYQTRELALPPELHFRRSILALSA
ncbi:MAG: DNA polymerase III subunit delta [Alphaproteobacteria bacterium]|nr:DNA polymerase III subunit delta [Alphaproteobacteria bacterium]MDD9919811.1 DNA polymerase III subunit delta [Alphaproteobacteria bacterium]